MAKRRRLTTPGARHFQPGDPLEIATQLLARRGHNPPVSTVPGTRPQSRFICYTDTEAATTTFSVRRPQFGRRQRHACVKQTKNNSKPQTLHALGQDRPSIHAH
jgi:hypothetical protein